MYTVVTPTNTPFHIAPSPISRKTSTLGFLGRSSSLLAPGTPPPPLTRPASSSTWPAIYLYLLAIVHLLLIPPLPPTCAPPAPSTLLPSTVTYTSTYTLAPLHLCIHAPATYTCLHSTNLLHLHLPATVHGSTFLEPASTSPPPRCTSTCLAPPPALHGPSSLSRTCHLNHPLSTSRSTSCTLPPPRLALLPPPRHAPPTPPRQHALPPLRLTRPLLRSSAGLADRCLPTSTSTSTTSLHSLSPSSIALLTSTLHFHLPSRSLDSTPASTWPPPLPRLQRSLAPPTSATCNLPVHLASRPCSSPPPRSHLALTPPPPPPPATVAPGQPRAALHLGTCHTTSTLLPPSATSTLTHLQLFHLQPSTPRSSAPPACTCAPRTTFQPLLLIAPPTLLLQALNASAPRCTSTSCNLYLTLPLPPLSPPCSTSTCTPPPPCAPAPLLTSLHISSTSALLYSTSTRPARPPAACHHHGSPLAIPPSWQPALSTSSNLQLGTSPHAPLHLPASHPSLHLPLRAASPLPPLLYTPPPLTSTHSTLHRATFHSTCQPPPPPPPHLPPPRCPPAASSTPRSGGSQQRREKK
ncbi:hypothetical protein C7M84_017511 [Penaeus vannamei]|uniref:Uncharacterized protein n=1 Tax=Penaeus vannamei TaxID=6689 RepID=A0A423SK62_PENVA|nr:hypothetical protein C7M84_017511 [Penaeus vannamei]